MTYKVDGKNYNESFNGYISSYAEGKEVEIYYDIDDPSKIGSRKINAVFAVLPIPVVIFIFISGIPLMSDCIGKTNKHKASYTWRHEI